MGKITATLLCLIVCLLATQIAAHSYYKDNSLFFEDFSPGWDSRWKHTDISRYNGRFTTTTPEGWNEHGLKIPEASRFYGISALTDKPIDISEGLMVQYEVKFSDGITCGGAYLKLVTASSDFKQTSLSNETPYSIMFGPDACGSNARVHLIFRYKNPVNGTITEKHLKDSLKMPGDDKTHIYTLIITADNKYEIWIDEEEMKSGSLLTDFEPSFQLPKEILDPSDTKPKDWVDDAKIPDPTATKPADWVDEAKIEDPKAKKPRGWLDDEEPFIPDPAAQKPDDWDEEEDGDWEPSTIANPKCKVGCGEWKRPLIVNPAYKGPWTPPLIDNPAYKGPWIQRQIPNPDYYEDAAPLKNVGHIGAVAIEVWTVDAGYTFGSIMITGDKIVAQEYRTRVWRPKWEKEEAMAAKRATAAADAEKRSLAEMMVEAFDQPFLVAIKPYVQPALDLLLEYQSAAYFIFVSPIFLLAALLFMCSSSKKGDDAGKRKKEDIPESDDEEDEEEEEEEKEQAAKVQSKKPAASSTKHSEIEAQGDEEEEAEPGPARRRKSKA